MWNARISCLLFRDMCAHSEYVKRQMVVEYLAPSGGLTLSASIMLSGAISSRQWDTSPCRSGLARSLLIQQYA